MSTPTPRLRVGILSLPGVSVLARITHPLTQPRILPHSLWDSSSREVLPISAARTISRSRTGWRSGPFFQAWVGMVKTFYAAREAVSSLRPRQVITTTGPDRACQALGGEIRHWNNPPWRKDNCPEAGTRKPAYRVFGLMDHWIRGRQTKGILAQLPFQA